MLRYSAFMAAMSSPMACVERERLTQVFLKAVSELNRIRLAQATAILQGDESSPFEEQITAATKDKENAISAILKHRGEHGC
jgi:hypothetical protein